MEISLNGRGIFSIGNIKPLSITVGKNIPVKEINIAVCCDSVTDEISKPNDKQVIVNKILSLIRSNKFHFMGTSSTNTLSNKILVILITDNNR